MPYGVLDVMVPGGEGWKANRKGTSFRYKNKDGFEGIRKIKIKTPGKRPGRVKFLVAGKQVGIDEPASLPVKGTLVIDAPLATTGQCGETAFAPDGCKRSRKGNKMSCR